MSWAAWRTRIPDRPDWIDDRGRVIFEAARARARVGLRLVRSSRLRLDDPPGSAAGREGADQQGWRAEIEAWLAVQLRLVAVPVLAAVVGLLGAAAARRGLPWAWPLVLGSGGGLALLIGWHAPRGPERSIGLPAVVVGTVGLTVTWALGTSRVAVIVDIVAVATMTLLWMAYGPLIRRAQATTAPAIVPDVLRGWVDHMVALGLTGTEATLVSQDADVVHLLLRLPVGRSIRDLGVPAVVDRLEAMLSRNLAPIRVPPGAVRLERDATAHLGHLFIELRDPLARRVPYPGPQGVAHGPIALAVRADGTPVRATLAGHRHVIVAGRNGSGKSRQMAVMVLELARPDTLVLGIDVVKRGADFGPIESAFHRLVTQPEDVAGLVDGVLRVREARAQWMANQGLQDWPTSPERPQIVLVIDEVTGVIRALGGVAKLSALAFEGRQQGIQLVIGAQRWKTESTGDSTALRSQAHVLIALRMQSRDEGADLFGHDRVAEGWWVHRLAPQGQALIWADGELETPTPYGTYWLETADAVRWANQRALAKPAPDPETAAALEPPAGPVVVVDPTETAEELLERLLAAGGREGVRRGHLAEAVAALPPERRRSLAWVAGWLDSHAESAGHGRWRLPPGENYPAGA